MYLENSRYSIGYKLQDISLVTLGTMRFSDKGISKIEVAKLLTDCHENGVTSLHVSSEYSSYELLCSVLKNEYKKNNNSHQFIAKIAGPHFSETSFSKDIFVGRVDSLLKDLGVEILDVAQWMWRMNPLDDDERIKRTEEKVDEMKETFGGLIQSGKVKSFCCFPYTSRYMKFVRDRGILSSQANYLNLWEDNLLDSGISPNSIVLRPLAAGRFKDSPPSLMKRINNGIDIKDSIFGHSIRYAVSHPNVRTIVVSMHDKKSVKEVVDTVNAAERSESLFNQYRSVIE